jgi:hypothetical protein
MVLLFVCVKFKKFLKCFENFEKGLKCLNFGKEFKFQKFEKEF